MAIARLATSGTALPGALVLSLDFELHWGLRDRDSDSTALRERLVGARAAVPRILSLFAEYDVAATWATVGFLFAASRDELYAASPVVRPCYTDVELDPYGQGVGEDEREDPVHYATSLIKEIQNTPRQEIGTHTFSHYYCRERGQTAEAFAADTKAAVAIARKSGLSISSMVFPRNQHNSAYDGILLANGITAYRGNPRSRMWRFVDAKHSASASKRSARLLDAYVPLHPVAELQQWGDVLQPNGLSNVRATTFLRPWTPRLRSLEPLRIMRLCGAVRRAARYRRLMHLWWHPHNFGLHTDENLAVLRAVLEAFAKCRDRDGMLSLTMAGVDRHVRAHAVAPTSTSLSVPELAAASSIT